MNYFIDTNIIIYAIKGNYPNIMEKFKSTPSFEIMIPSIVSAELEYGAKKSSDYQKTIEVYRKFLSIYKVVPFTENEIEIYGDIRSELEKSGNMIGANDLLIASIVLSHNGILVTHNVGEFARIKKLKIEDWTL